MISFIIFILDWIGRKKPLMFGAASFVALFSILSALVASFPPGEHQSLAAQKAAIAMIFMMSIVFSLSFGPVSWVLAAEVSQMRSHARTRVEHIPGISYTDAIHWDKCRYVRELVAQHVDFRNVANWDGQCWLEILSTLCLPERSGLYRHCALLPRDKRQVPPKLFGSVFFTRHTTGKSLEEMASLFGDEVDARQVLAEHIDRTEDPLAEKA